MELIERDVVVSNEMSPRRKSVKETKQILREFFSSTAAHGWNHVIRRNRLSLQVLWGVLTVAALGVNAGHVTILVHQYLQFPYEQVTEVEVSEIVFPSVTVCNTQANSMTATRDLLNDPNSKLFRWNNTTNNFLSALKNTTNDTYYYRTTHDRFRGPRGFYENIGDEVKQVGHSAQDLITDCIYQLGPCSWRDFTFFTSADYFNCYTFNGGNMSADKLMGRATGPQAGLSLVMYVEGDSGDPSYQTPYYSYRPVGNAAGVRVIVHAPDTWASPVDHGFDVPPGYSSAVGLKVTHFKRLGRPYAFCEASLEQSDSTYRYSSHECYLQCQQRYIVSRCHCVSAGLPHSDRFKESLPYCGFYNESRPNDVLINTKCEVESRQEFVKDEARRRACICEAPCDEYHYEPYISQSYWPLDAAQESFYSVYIDDNPQRDSLKAYKNLRHFNVSYLVRSGLLRKNFVRLNIFLESLVIQEYRQKGSYTFFSLFSDIGGTFGLWIGMSLLTWGEVIELVIKIVVSWCRKVKSGLRVHDNMKS